MKKAFPEALTIKERHAGLFRALQADARDYPGGVSELADQTGYNYHTLRNGLCPTAHGQVPAFELVVDVIENTGAPRTLQYLARLGGQTVMPAVDVGDGSLASVSMTFLAAVHSVGVANATAAEALADNVLTRAERVKMADDLEPAIADLIRMRDQLRGGA